MKAKIIIFASLFCMICADFITLSASDTKQDNMDRDLTAAEKYFHSRDFKKAREAFDSVLKLDSRNARAQYCLGLIEYEEGNIEKAKLRFQIAYECMGTPGETINLPINTKQVQLEFPDEYKARIYYKDGWYIKPKNPPEENKNLYLLDSGSTYRIELKTGHKRPWLRNGLLGMVVLFSFLLIR